MKHKDFLRPGNYYLIYNHGNGSESIFKCERNYHYFLKKHNEHMNAYWDLVAWCFLPDCFMLIVRVKGQIENEFTWHGVNKIISKSFGNFANGYAKSINKSYNRRGSLFAKNYCRKLIQDNYELRKTIVALHEQPVLRNYVSNPYLYKFSSCHKANLYTHDAQFENMISPFITLENFKQEHEFEIQYNSAA